MQPVPKITAGRVPWFLGSDTVHYAEMSPALAGEQDPAFGCHTRTPELVVPRAALGRLDPLFWCSRSAQTPLGLAEGCPCCTHSPGGQGLQTR